MIDFLRSNTWCSREEYLWGMSVAQVQLSSIDFTHIDYDKRKHGGKTKGKGKSFKTITSGDTFANMTDVGSRIITENNIKR